MEEQFSCDEDEWEGQEGSLLSSRCSPACGGARWSQPGGQVSDHSDTLADQSEEVESRMSEMSTGSRNSKMSSGRKSMSRINYKADHGSYLHLSGDEDETEDTREEGKIGSEEYVLPRRVSGGNFARGSSAGWETGSQAARSILGGIFTNLPITGETREGSQEMEVSQLVELEVNNLKEDDNDEEEDPRLEVARRMEELDEVHKSFSERMTDWISSVSLKQKEEEDEHFGDFDEASLKELGEALLENSVSDFDKSGLGNDFGDKQEDDLRGSTPSSVSVGKKGNSTDDISTKSSRVNSCNDSMVGMEEKNSDIESNWKSGGEKELRRQSDEEVRNKFHCDRSQRGIAYSMIPTLAFSSYEEGFAKAQLTNGRQLFDNGLIRQRSTGSRVRSLPFPEAQQPQYKKVVEMMEQRMVVDADGTQRVDTKHRREQEERNDGAWSWCNSFVFMIGSFSLLLLCLLVVFILVPSQHSVDLRRCLLQDIQGLPQEPETMNSI